MDDDYSFFWVTTTNVWAFSSKLIRFWRSWFSGVYISRTVAFSFIMMNCTSRLLWISCYSYSRVASLAASSKHASISYFSIAEGNSSSGSAVSPYFKLNFPSNAFPAILFNNAFFIFLLFLRHLWVSTLTALFLSFSILSNLWSIFISAFYKWSPILRSLAENFLVWLGSCILLIKEKGDLPFSFSSDVVFKTVSSLSVSSCFISSGICLLSIVVSGMVWNTS